MNNTRTNEPSTTYIYISIFDHGNWSVVVNLGPLRMQGVRFRYYVVCMCTYQVHHDIQLVELAF